MPIISPKLGPNNVHVWALRTDPFAAPERLPELAAVLSKEERQAAERYRTRQLTERYVVSHALVRHVLSNYLKVSPSDILPIASEA